MVTRARFRSVCLSMPEAEEKAHFGKPDFRVNNKIFAGLTHEPQLSGGDTPQPERGYFKARPELREELLALGSGAFTPAQGAWGRSGWTYVELPQVKLGVLREVIYEAWRLVAPAKLVAEQAAAARRRSAR